MSLEQALGRMESLLVEEREAIKRVDARTIGALAEEKESLMRAIAAGGLGDRPELAPRFRSLVAALRESGVLLVHARNCLRDILQLAGAPTTYRPGGEGATPPSPRRLSVNL
jgi:hypothetical protein